MSKTKILILHTSVGHGIKVTALNVAQKLEASGKYEVRVEDIQKVVGGSSGRLFQKIYLAILDRFSFVWGFLYTSRIVLWLSLPIRKPIARFRSKNLLKLLREYQPAIVISTQTISTGIVAYLKSKGLYRGQLVAVFSDFHLHRFWMYREVDLYICAIAEQVAELKRLKVPQEKIAVTGLILGEIFEHTIDKDEARRELGLLTTMPTVLVFNGARPRMEIKELFLRLLRSTKSFQIVVVCALNEELKKALEEISPPAPHPVKILGYAHNMDVLMTAASVMIGKTGGPTMGEAILKQLPIILIDVRAGHEQVNLEYLLRNDIAQYARNPAEATFFVEQILNGQAKPDWTKANRKLIKPEGWVSIVQAIDRIRPQETSKISGLTIKNYQFDM